MRHLGCALAFLVTAALAAPSTGYANILITVDKSAQQMSVVVDGTLRWRWRVSTGAPGYDTPGGNFRAFRMEASHFSKQYDDAPMPHSIFFTPRGHAIHGYLDTRHLGLPVSHGCVRLDPQNAAALYALVKQEGVLNTTVVVTGHVSAGAVARRGSGSRYDETNAGTVETPSYTPSYGYGSSNAPYASRDERYAPLTSTPPVAQQYPAQQYPAQYPAQQYPAQQYPVQQPAYARPNTPPGYPPFPRPYGY